jgi:hypothetical protein
MQLSAEHLRVGARSARTKRKYARECGRRRREVASALARESRGNFRGARHKSRRRNVGSVSRRFFFFPILYAASPRRDHRSLAHLPQSINSLAAESPEDGVARPSSRPRCIFKMRTRMRAPPPKRRSSEIGSAPATNLLPARLHFILPSELIQWQPSAWEINPLFR